MATTISESKEWPIIFTGESVRAILDGRKTQTRRLVRFAVAPNDPSSHSPWRCWQGGMGAIPAGRHEYEWQDGDDLMRCPYGYPGDRLWVRETWGAVSKTGDMEPIEECNIEYRADLPEGCTDYPGQWPIEHGRGNDEAPKWRSSIHMPRWASRITLEVTAVRVERLQDISRTDALAEGMPEGAPNDLWKGHPVSMFCLLWQQINGKRAPWASNPWVWVIEFRRVQS